MVCSAVRFHGDQTPAGQIRAPEHERLSLQYSICDNLAGSIHCVDLNQVLGQIDANSGNLVNGASPTKVCRLTFANQSWHLRPLPGNGRSLCIHIGVDAQSGLTHALVTTPAKPADVSVANQLLHGQERYVFGDEGYRGVKKRHRTKQKRPHWHVGMRRGKHAVHFQIRRWVESLRSSSTTKRAFRSRLNILFTSSRACWV
jgi:hypothetical protein